MRSRATGAIYAMTNGLCDGPDDVDYLRAVQLECAELFRNAELSEARRRFAMLGLADYVMEEVVITLLTRPSISS
jgi:hypothetical protein